MLNHFLSLTLATVIFGCPFYCGLPAAADGADSSCSGCCHHREASPPADSEPAPADDSHSSQGACQCICGGAVIDHWGLPVTPTDLTGFAAAPMTVSLVVCESEARLNALHALLQPDDGMNPGRAMRCLFMTYLC